MRKKIVGPGFEYLAAVDPKDAEIERLNAENAALKMAIVEFQTICRDNNALITELADALVTEEIMFNEGDELIQRAREATK